MDLEISAIDELLYMAIEDIANLEDALRLSWVRDDISEAEHEALDRLGYLDRPNPSNLSNVLSIAWVQDDISAVEYGIIHSLGVLDLDASDTVSQLISMPFLFSPDSTDALAIRGMHWLAEESLLEVLTDHAIFQDDITDDETTLIAGAGTLDNQDEIRKVLEPGVAAIETIDLGTEATPHLKISIIRAGSQSRPGTVESVQDAVEFVEQAVGLPLPVDHVIIMLNDHAVTREYAGTNFGFAYSYKPEYEAAQGTWEWRHLQTGFTHETAHYFWSGNENWIDEGLANIVEYQFGLQMGLSHGQLQAKRGGCEAHDLEMLSEWNPHRTEYDRFDCNYYLGQLLFQDLLAAMDPAAFTEKLREFYLLSVAEQEAGGTPGIAEVRQVFPDQTEIVERHWSGNLNAPENRPFDEGYEYTSHDLVEWEMYPTFEGGYVQFKGRLLGEAIHNHGVGGDAVGKPQNFTLRLADSGESYGNILPPLPGGRTWNLSGSDSVVASTYLLNKAEGTFNVKFQFAGNIVGDPEDYVVKVNGYQDPSRTPTISERIDTLGYARIRVQS